MRTPPSTAAALMTRVGRRLRARLILRGLAWGSLGALLLSVWGRSGEAPLSPGLSISILAGAAVAIAVAVRQWGTTSPASAARAIERRQPAARNVVITVEELARHPDRVSSWMRERVLRDADEAVRALRPAAIVPARQLIAPALVAVALAAGTATIQQAGPVRMLTSMTETVDRLIRPASSTTIAITVHPPAYTGFGPQVLDNPETIDVLEGSRLEFETPSTTRVRFGDRAVSGEWLAREGGYFAVEAPAGERRLISLIVRSDRVPVVRIESPGKDLLLPDGGRSVPITITATDDLGLDAVELRYTKVTGRGEQFEFVEGTLPVRVERKTERDWRAQASLALSALGLESGDSLVYRAVSRDRRPGMAGLGTSDTFLVEIAGPGQVAFEGVEMPPELERYAMSQQMIVLKLERLRSRERAMSRDALVEEAAALAAEQRTVRANFVFLLGGHVEDEEEEAEQSHEIQEGRLENTARRDIDAAIGQMTRAERGMTAVDTGAALPPARAAVESLQRAFGRSRYLLRSLAVRSRLDPSRRLTGDLRGAADWRRTPNEGGEDDASNRIRSLLVRLIQFAASAPTLEPTVLDSAAEAALSLGPSSPVWQDVSRELLEAKRRADDPSARSIHLERAIAGVRSELRPAMLPRLAPEPSTPLRRAYRRGTQR